MEYFSFSETKRFQRNGERLIGDDDLAELQLFLCASPEFGKIIPEAGGIRKMRWRLTGRGKRGGARIIYFVSLSRYRILLIDVYSKNEKEDLSRSELNEHKHAVEAWLGEK